MRAPGDSVAGRTWRVGLVGCGWISKVYAESFAMLPNAEVVACCAARAESARRFAAAHGVARALDDWRRLVESPDVDVVTVGTPNALHAEVAIAALTAGKHVIVEKPLAMSLEECHAIAEAAARANRVVGYAENLCFVPKFVEAKRRADAGELGEVRFLKQIEKHEGPHSRWFFEAATAGGGALLDMGCHSIEFARWFLGKPDVTAVWATMDTWLHVEGVHEDVTELDDHVLVHLEFATGATALLESGWSLKGGMASRTEIQGTGGVLHANLLHEGSGMSMFSDRAEPAGWQSLDADWHRLNGYPQELAHFLGCMETGAPPLEGVEDGIAVLEIMLAAYASAGTGRKVTLPFRPRGVRHPVDLWKSPPRLDAMSSYRDES